MSPRYKVLRRVLILLATNALLFGGATLVAAPASAQASCTDNSRESAAAIANDYNQRDHRENTIPEPVQAGPDAQHVVKLRYADAPYHCVWALIGGPDGSTAWIDRRDPGATTWDGKLGERAIRSGNGTTYTAAFSIAGKEVRACGTWAIAPGKFFCTSWFAELAAAPPLDSGGSAAPSAGSASTASAPAKPTQVLAQQILDLADAGKISISPVAAGEGVASDTRDRSLPRLQLRDIANGKPAQLSTRCSYASRYHSNPIEPDPQFLSFLVDLGKTTHYTINVLLGQCHPKSAENSFHHKGQAADFACGLDTAAATAVGRKYGVSQFTGESCDPGPTYAAHWHYSVGGH